MPYLLGEPSTIGALEKRGPCRMSYVSNFRPTRLGCHLPGNGYQRVRFRDPCYSPLEFSTRRAFGLMVPRP